MPKIDLDTIEATNRTGYPPPLDAPVKGRWNRRLGPAAGLTDMAASHCTLEPGAWSSQRHVHDSDDELLIMLEGEAVLIEDEGRTLLRPGDIAAFPKAGTAHHLVNESDRPCAFIAISPSAYAGGARYPDVDLHLDDATGGFTHKDGRVY
ncbi:MAG TPA: cupin domain-containing protein [Sphingomonas sp.]|nr:cupin domain-containing protein [Sphingomonas sp.]